MRNERFKIKSLTTINNTSRDLIYIVNQLK
jgi:hypothetical protein